MNIPQRVIDELSGFTQEAAKAYHAVYDGKDERKTRFIDQICRFFTAANDVYAKAEEKWDSDAKKITTLASWAETALRHARIAFSEWTGRKYWKFTCDDNAAELRVIDQVSAKLEQLGWLHLPILRKRKDGKEEVTYKTAAGVVKDMNDIIAARARLMAEFKV